MIHEIDDDDAESWALRRCKQLMADFKEQHPARAAASKFVDDLIVASHAPADATRADRERARSGGQLFVSWDILSRMFDAAPNGTVEEFVFKHLLDILHSVYELGQHAAPDGKAARERRSELAGAKGRALEAAVRVYCEARGLEPKAGEKFAGIIRPHVLELLGLPKKAKSPAVSTIVKALQEVQESGAAL
jgi:hypothetical protein